MSASMPPLLLQTPSTTSPLLEEPIRIIAQPSVKRILLRFGLDTTPVILSEIGIVHEERSVDVRKKTLVNVLLDKIVQAAIQILVGLVDLLIVCGEAPGKVKLDKDIVCVSWDGEKVLCFVSWGGFSGKLVIESLTPPRSTAF